MRHKFVAFNLIYEEIEFNIKQLVLKLKKGREKWFFDKSTFSSWSNGVNG